MTELTEQALDGTMHRPGCWYPRTLEDERGYLNRWPNHCEHCDGWGGFPFYESHTGYSGYDPCPHCLEQGRCPRCGEGVIAETYWDHGETAICDSCGYIEATTQGHSYVDEPCNCLEPPYRYIENADVWINGIGEAY